MSVSKTRCRLYLISPPEIPDLDAFAPAFKAALDAGDVACVQLRLKSADGATPPDEEIEQAARRLGPLAQARDVAFLINDRPDIAKRTGADGVHIGQGDASLAEARALLGDEATIGVTCHASRHLAMEAGEAGADYVAFGAFYPTVTKAAAARAEPELLAWWSELFTIPSVAIGGITAENCGALARAGADFVAVSSGVWRHERGPAAGVAAINAALEAARIAP
ncbi:MAG: thiamine phosphate synthase [Parvularculaceae bacterium]